ncbi:hypothetical protein [Gephyromycinifex aptenodytis]|uniref:hypothetical protein n=1 Tax=Gephyromycinifex aptenodytis TaxID=2716227 RepID=UPI00144890E7|nr:hypothetical protein [Gephyromycinifex aptenodytis]
MIKWLRRQQDSGPEVPVELGPKDRVLARQLEAGGCVVVATLHELILLHPERGELARRRWLEVDAGSWDSLTATISVTWVDGSRAAQWTFPEGSGVRFAEVFHDRVQASLIIDAPIQGPTRQLGKAAIRKDLCTDELVPQLIWSRGVRRGDSEAMAAGQSVLRSLAELVDLDLGSTGPVS